MGPFDAWRTGLSFWTMMAEAQTVIALRMMGAAGVVDQRADEPLRMVAEKGQAFAEATTGMTTALLRGQSPARVVEAGLRPYRRKTRANVRRLSAAARKS